MEFLSKIADAFDPAKATNVVTNVIQKVNDTVNDLPGSPRMNLQKMMILQVYHLCLRLLLILKSFKLGLVRFFRLEVKISLDLKVFLILMVLTNAMFFKEFICSWTVLLWGNGQKISLRVLE